MLYFIVNKNSGSGKGADAWRKVQNVLRDRNIRYRAFCTEHEGHAYTLAGTICENGDPDICLIVVGGDGTANEVINGITHFDRVRFGMIPTGSGNDFARGLQMKGDPAELLMQILQCAERGPQAARPIDLGEVSLPGMDTPRRFSISAGAGLDAIVCKKALHSRLKKVLNHLHLGKLTYLFLTVHSLFSMKTADAAVCFDKDIQVSRRKAICFAIMNFGAEGGGVPMAPHASATDGRLSVCSIFGIPKWRAFLSLPLLVTARHSKIRGFSVTDCRECRIKLKEKMLIHTDGEYCDKADRLHVACLPGLLRVLL